jgi:transposase
MLALERGAASMGAAVAIERLDMTASALRAAASREKDGAAARRILALALLLDGADRKTAAETCGMDRQTLRDWVHRYNAEGLTGLHDLTPSGPKPKLTAEQQAELAGLVETGPDPARHGVVRWRRVDLRDELQRRFGVALHERSVGKVLAKLGYCRLSVRPRHPQTDEEAQEAFKLIFNSCGVATWVNCLIFQESRAGFREYVVLRSNASCLISMVYDAIMC